MTMRFIENQYRPQSASMSQQVEYPDVDRDQPREFSVLHMEQQQQKANAEQYLKASLNMTETYDKAREAVYYPLWQGAVNKQGFAKVMEGFDAMDVIVSTAKKQVKIASIFRDFDGPNILSSNTIDIKV